MRTIPIKKVELAKARLTDNFISIFQKTSQKWFSQLLNQNGTPWAVTSTAQLADSF